MVIVNPPFTLINELRIILPEMAKVLSQGDSGWRVSVLVPDAERKAKPAQEE
jgi:23S rRNA A2030 N6-methylase RlmJ